MIEILSNTIQTTLDSFDFSFCIIVNILTYLVIKIINDKKNKELSKWSKRKVLLIVIFSTGVVYYLIGTDNKHLINSAILSPVFWSWIMKPLCQFFNIDYKQINIFE